MRRRALLALGALLAVAAATLPPPGSVPPALAQDADVSEGRLDLNRASLRDLEQLPVSQELARAIHDYRSFEQYFESAYDLNEVEGMTPEVFSRLLPLVSTLPPDPVDEAIRRYDDSFRQVQRFLGREGASEELADEYLDLLREPRDVNTLTLYELQAYQNVSPVDAVAILRARERTGSITSSRQVRSSDGLRYWGYRNLRDFVVYEPPERDMKLRGDVQFLTFNTPYLLSDRDILIEPLPGADPIDDFETSTGWGVRGLDSANPAFLSKLRLRLGSQWKAGFMSFRDVGEQDLDETLKGYISFQPEMQGENRLDRVVLGNYRVAFGQGLVMDNTDFFLPRKTGFGWNKRPATLVGDLSRSYEYALRGVAAQGTVGPFFATAFFSHGKKDGLINRDGTINKYVTMLPRFETEELEAMVGENGSPIGLRRDAFEETLFGGNVKFQISPGTYVGLTGYEARYDTTFNPSVIDLVARADLLDSRDAEVFQAYDSRQLGEFRRVVGAEFQTVFKNLAIQGEYAKLDANERGGIEGLFHSAPDAYVVNAYLQYQDFNILALWRDYDAGFDNPYARGFSNDSRYEQTLLGDPFRLQHPLLSWLETTDPQMKAERGLFVTTRFRVRRNFTITGLDYDVWKRVADNQDLRRYTARMEYAPIFPLRFRLRQRFSSRSEEGIEDVRAFRGWDTRLEMRVRLSGYDELRFLYSATSTAFAPRPRLSGTEGSDDSALSQAASPGTAFQAMYTHNVNERLSFTVSSEMYDGFLWNFEDNEFVVLDGTGFRNWFLISSRLSDNLLMRLKLTNDAGLAKSNVALRDDSGVLQVIGDDTRRHSNSFRLQLDYTF